MRPLFVIIALALSLVANCTAAEEITDPLQLQAISAMKRAATYYRSKVATHGGYVYHYSLDLKVRWGEGLATENQIWVQPPGTPTVGIAYLKAYDATGDSFYLDAATDAAEAIAYGQLKSGGWTNMIDFNPRGRTAQYRNGKGKGKNYSSLDDGQTQSAIRLLVLTDKALGFRHKEIHLSAKIALDALLAAQFQCGAFPQVWTGPVAKQPVLKANYPDYDWRTEGRIKEYWNMYTLNDNVAGYVADTLTDAYRVYDDTKYLAALARLGDFLLSAQMPDPQPGWAQQYNYRMQPIWARKFEPPGVSGDETQEALETLLHIYRVTGNRKYLEPFPRALSWLKKSLLKDGRIARYYELKTNRPLYMVRSGKKYSLTFDDSKLPKHYGWKTASKLEQLERAYEAAMSDKKAAVPRTYDLQRKTQEILKQLDGEYRWVSTYTGERLVGQPKFALQSRYLSSEVFSRNLDLLSAFLSAKETSE